jgi:hypothetical protein
MSLYLGVEWPAGKLYDEFASGKHVCEERVE